MPKLTRVQWVMWAGIAVATVIVAGILAAYFVPYDDIMVEPYGDIETDEYTSTGTPVLRQGAILRHRISFCSTGRWRTSIESWADQFGPYLGADGEKIAEGVERSRPTTSTLIETRIFERIEEGCSDSAVAMRLPPSMAPGSIYRIRSIFSYRPNPFRVVPIERSTEQFLLLREGDPIP